jgi:AcrR family transcriptional regulator
MSVRSLNKKRKDPFMTPRAAWLNERLRAESRARIIEHALRLFGQHGYDRTSIKMIADAAGISQGLIYRYFASKDALLQAIFEQSMEDVRASFAAAAGEAEPRARIERLIRASFEILQQNELFWRLSYGVRMQASVLEGLSDQVTQWTGEIQGVLEEFLRAAGEAQPEVEAAVLFALIDGVSQHYVMNPGQYPLRAVIEHIVSRYQGGAPAPVVKRQSRKRPAGTTRKR